MTANISTAQVKLTTVDAFGSIALNVLIQYAIRCVMNALIDNQKKMNILNPSAGESTLRSFFDDRYNRFII